MYISREIEREVEGSKLKKLESACKSNDTCHTGIAQYVHMNWESLHLLKK